MSSYGRYSDASDGSSRNESYTDRFRVHDTSLSSASGGLAGMARAIAPERSRLARLIDRACDPSNLEPNLSLNLEIADLINEKKGNSAREAATQIVKLVNSRSTSVSILALALLDICVKNCGYPFHLQISRKEFLNDLVRKFPERPPPRTTRTQQLILEAVEEWRETICQTSRYKEDLGYIRDMHRLLAYKGYQFPKVDRDDAAVLNPSDSIKSAEEMEEEERAAQSAKLQELIRRGKPADLLEANQLMKVMAGYDTAHATDYRAKMAEDLAKIQRKAKLLDEMLDGVRNGDAIGRQDAFEELYTAIRNSQPKIQKIISDEGDDAEAVTRLLALNDNINQVITKYDTVKATRRSNSSTPISGQSRAGSPTRTQPQPSNVTSAMNLIDFDDEIEVSSSAPAMSPQGIFLSASPTPTQQVPLSQNPMAALRASSPQGAAPQQSSTAAIMAQFASPSFASTPSPSFMSSLPSSQPQPMNSLFSSVSQAQQQQPIVQQQSMPQFGSTPRFPSLGQPFASHTPSPGSASSPMTAQLMAPVQSVTQPTQQLQQPPEQSNSNASGNLLDLDGFF
ncbi:VHS domain-containing protein [Lipomyces arxii]|uniref:VHS domain-containing protein n=1 Tax=Lipomyces arxii TaxID=56418 RepID=UPI0034CD7B51